MRRATGGVKLAVIGVGSVAVYGSAVPLSAALGVEPLLLHLFVFGGAVALYLLALWTVMRGWAAGPGALGIILGNLYWQTLEEIWWGASYRQFRSAIQTDQPPEPCRGCGVKWSL